ncbi:MAG: tol-pal system protein YbgF [Deltaproteobacteria bacterium]|nr:tol-pal system protein YbgF [Deltaproteobacteria bacterium]
MKRILNLAIPLTLLISTPLFAAGELDQIRNEMALLKSSVENSNLKLADAMNSLLTLQQEVNTLKGASESEGHLYDQQNKTLKDYDQRIATLEDKLNLSMTLLSEIKENRGSEKTLAADEAQTKEFQRLLDFINAEDYAKALTGFQDFLQKYPKSNLADHAQYWMAESLYALADYKKAITEYQTLIQKYPKSSKVKSAIFKQGLSFMGLKMYPEAKAFFEKIVATYPNSSEASRSNVKIKEIDKLSAESPTSLPASQPVPPNSNPVNKPMSGGMYN